MVKKDLLLIRSHVHNNFIGFFTIWNFLKDNFEDSVASSIKAMKVCKGHKSVIFEVPEKNAYIFD